jgi:methyl-accepting chemotaxis protein
MEQLVQQNAALVEESAAATENMAALAEDLNQTVARFKLDEASQRAAADLAPRAAVTAAPAKPSAPAEEDAPGVHHLAGLARAAAHHAAGAE